MLTKNQILTLEIIDISSDGNGIAKHEGIVIFVPMVAVGDICNVKIVKVLKNYCFGIVDDIITPSKDRRKSPCLNFSQCGGCDFLHINYQAEKIAKQNFVKACFKRIAKSDCEVNPTMSTEKEYRYRNKAQFPVRQNESGEAVTGFYAQRSHRIIPVEDCLLQSELMNEIALFTTKQLNNLNIKAYDEVAKKGDIRHIFLRQGEISKEIMLCLVATKKSIKNLDKLVELITQKFPQITSFVLNINNKNTNVILGDEDVTLFGKDTIVDVLCGVEIELNAHSFYQVNHQGAEELYGIAKNSLQLDKDEVLLDFYCGAGSIGLSMAKDVKSLIGIEIVPQAVENAIENAKKYGAENAQFICADAKEGAKLLLEQGHKPTSVIVDPPRKGCDEDTLQAIIEMQPEKICMISCNPSTAARDCELLEKNGYKIKLIQPYDMFPNTRHVEAIILMTYCGDKAKNEG